MFYWVVFLCGSGFEKPIVAMGSRKAMSAAWRGDLPCRCASCAGIAVFRAERAFQKRAWAADSLARSRTWVDAGIEGPRIGVPSGAQRKSDFEPSYLTYDRGLPSETSGIFKRNRFVPETARE